MKSKIFKQAKLTLRKITFKPAICMAQKYGAQQKKMKKHLQYTLTTESLDGFVVISENVTIKF